jgi:hypothetical protein
MSNFIVTALISFSIALQGKVILKNELWKCVSTLPHLRVAHKFISFLLLVSQFLPFHVSRELLAIAVPRLSLHQIKQLNISFYNVFRCNSTYKTFACDRINFRVQHGHI